MMGEPAPTAMLWPSGRGASPHPLVTETRST
jgi:hypothetical protein